MADGVPHVVGDHHGGETVFPHDAVGKLENLGRRCGIERGGMLVEQQQPGLLKRRHQQRYRLPLAAGEKPDLRCKPILQTEIQLAELFAVHIALVAADVPAKPELFAAPVGESEILLELHIRGGAHHRVLKDAPDERRALIVRETGDVVPVDDDRTAVNRPYARHSVQKRGFSRAVAADHRDEVALLQMKIDARERPALVDRAGVERFVYAINVEHHCPIASFCPRFFARLNELMDCFCRYGTARNSATISAVKSLRSFGSSRSQRMRVMTM